MTLPVDRMIRPEVKDIIPYSPGKPVEEVEREYGLEGAVKLASNENSLGPSPAAVRAAKEAAGEINIYPDGGCFYLKRALGEFLGVSPESLVTGNGSDEIIRIITETFLGPGEEAVFSEPSFVVYETAVRVMGGKCRPVPLKKDFSYDVDGILGSITSNTKLVFFANPNNPTGTALSAGDAGRYMENLPEGVVTVFDEAYFEYVETKDYPDSLEFIRSGAPVVCLRTFSKIYGLAGLRIGYGVTQPGIAAEMNRVRQPFNVNSVAQKAAMAALADAGHVAASRKMNTEGKRYLYGELEKLGAEYVPSEANFVLARLENIPAAAEKLLLKGVIVRGMACYGLDDWIRVTVGRREENERFINALKQVKEEV